MFSSPDSNPTLIGCSLSGNTASYGGAVSSSGDNQLIARHCTLSGNVASDAGGGFYSFGGSSLSISNCILWGDSPDEIAREDAAVTVRHSDVQGGVPAGSTDGGGNGDFDPMFRVAPNPGGDGSWNGVDDDYGDLRLEPGSWAINAGDPNFVPDVGETDIDGHSRVLCDRVDMGAFEFGIGDYDCDGEANLSDFAAWPVCATGPGDEAYGVGCEAFDFDGNGAIDLVDFAGIQRLGI